MNEIININTAQTEPSLSVKMRSWKWWVYGEINPQPLAKTPWHYYALLVTDILFWLVFILLPWTATWVNREPPALSTLQSVHGRVIDTRGRGPHVRIVSDDGSHLQMMFPTFLSDLLSPSGGAKSLGPANASVRGCQATVWFDKPRYMLFENYRIWQIRCDDGSEEASYDDIVAEAGLTYWLIWTGIMGFLVFPLLAFIYLERSKRMLDKK